MGVICNVFLLEYSTIDQWQMMSVREKDTAFVDTFLTAAVGILRTKDCKDTATDRTSFSIVPKKVKIVSYLLGIFNCRIWVYLTADLGIYNCILKVSSYLLLIGRLVLS